MPPKFHPRAPSPLHYEPISNIVEEILCPGSDEEATFDVHRNKRQRIEALGTQYLRGRGLLISTASLRGPFENGWDNPWARRRPRRDIKNISQIPEEPRKPANIDREKRVNGLEVSGPTARPGLETDGDQVVRACSPVRGKSAEQAPAQKQQIREFGAYTKGSIASRHGSDGNKQYTNNFSPFKNVDPTSATPIGNEQSRSRNHWLKIVRKEHFQMNSPSPSSTPTPLPEPRSRNRTPRHPPVQVEPLPMNPRVFDHVQNAVSDSGFTPINKPRVQHTMQKALTKKSEESAKVPDIQESSKRLNEPSNILVRDTTLSTADELTKMGYSKAKILSQEAVKKAEADRDAHVEARKLSQEGALRALCVPTVPQPKITDLPLETVRKALLGSPHEVPPSTNLPGFAYRVPKKVSPLPSRESTSFSEKLEAAKANVKAKRPSSLTRATGRFAEEMEAAQTKAKAQAIRRLNFTASGRVNVQGLRGGSKGTSKSLTRRQQGSPLRRVESSHGEISSGDDAYASASSRLPSVSDDVSKPEALREAQIVAANLGGTRPLSDPSTNLLETDQQSLEFPGIDEGDSYMNLSTQAAIAKAQRSFQNDVVSPLKLSPQKHRSNGELSPTAYKTSKAALPLSLTSKFVDGQIAMSDDDEPISTQAMIDAMSPFAVTTVKKNPNLVRRASFARSAITSPGSPIASRFRPQSPSMSTSVSTSPSPTRHLSPPPRPSVPIPLSKATSSLTSFSIAPNGTLTEVYQHDGQQQPFVDADGWDLEEALEEAGSFLGTWEVEAEARKAGKTRKGGSSGMKGSRTILSSGQSVFEEQALDI